MTAIEQGLYSRGSSRNSNGPGEQRQNGGGGGGGGEYYRGPEQNFGPQRHRRGRRDEGGWNGYGGNNY